MANSTSILFESTSKEDWIRNISSIHNEYESAGYNKNVLLLFDTKIVASDFHPVHLVTLACLIQFLNDKGHQVWLSGENKSVRCMLMEQLKFHEYWSGGKNHVEATSNDIFNLWRIVDSEKDLYARNVERYFNSNFFKNKDLSFVSLSMVEAYYNIFDHAYSDGNAFSIIKYDSEKEVLNVAICDFGIGIAKSVRTFNDSIKTDKDALAKSIEVDFTVGSKSHNKGKGLDNILCCSDVVRLLANNALLVKSGGIRFFDTDFDFKGTLIYFDLSLKEAEEEEVLDEFII